MTLTHIPTTTDVSIATNYTLLELAPILSQGEEIALMVAIGVIFPVSLIGNLLVRLVIIPTNNSL